MAALKAVFGLVVLSTGVHALRTTANSPCTNICGTTTNTTSPSEIVCLDNQYNTTQTGKTFQSCVSCLLESDFQDSQTGETDVNWGLYNLRFAFSSCVYNYPQAVTNVSTPCLVSCTPLSPALEFQLTNPVGNSLDTFCGDSAFADNTVTICEQCYTLTAHQAFLTNFLESVRYNCHFETAAGTSFPVTPTTIFNATELPITTAAYTTAASSGGSSAVQQYLTVIIIMPIVGFLILAALTALCCFCLVRHRRKLAKRRRYNSGNIHARWNDAAIGTPWQSTWGGDPPAMIQSPMAMADPSQHYMMGAAAPFATTVPGNGFQVVEHDGKHYEAGYSTHYVSPVDSDVSASQQGFHFTDSAAYQNTVAQQRAYASAQWASQEAELLQQSEEQKQPLQSEQEVYYPPPPGAAHAL